MIQKLLQSPHINQRNALYLLVAMHVAGLIGLAIPATEALFKSLTPFNLVATAAIVFHFQEDKNAKYIFFILVTFLVGYFVEVAGVATGMLFGEYQYGDTLGFKWLDVPLVIGLNWAVLVYGSGTLASRWSKNLWLKAGIGASLMTLLDVLIEPVAIRFDFWNWEAIHVPIQNYLAWFVTSFILHVLFQSLNFEKDNSLAVKVFVIQVLFFSFLNFI